MMIRYVLALRGPYHVGCQLGRHLAWNVTNLGPHDIFDLDGIAIILVISVAVN